MKTNYTRSLTVGGLGLSVSLAILALGLFGDLPTAGATPKTATRVRDMDFRPLSVRTNLPAGAIYADATATPEARAQDVVHRLTFEEKLELTGGVAGMYFPGVERLGLRPVHMADASQGIRLKDAEPAGAKSTSFPCTLMLAATWDEALAFDYAKAIGEECRANGIDILLGPGLNIYRHSEGGRNFEYLGEDPFLASRFATQYVRGLQSLGTVATIKHYIGNEQEVARHTVNVVIGERALREIYLPAFVAAINEGGAGAVMTGNNFINGWPGAADQPLVGGLLRKELGFRGIVMSDWANSVFWPERCSLVLSSGQSLLMAQNTLFTHYVLERIAEHPEQKPAVERALDEMVFANFYPLFKAGIYDRAYVEPDYRATFKSHQLLARRTAEEGITLLKNEDGILPIDPRTVERILVTGTNEALAIFSGQGSGEVAGYEQSDYPAGLRKIYGDKVTVRAEPTDDEIRHASIVLFFIAKRPSEGMDFPFEHPAVSGQVNHLAALNSHLAVIYSGGNGFAMPWLKQVKALVFAYLGGQEAGNALAEILSGQKSPSGRLPFTIEKDFADGPGKDYNRLPDGKFEWGGDREDSKRVNAQFGQFEVKYHEGIYVGYRWFEKKHLEPQFPFGCGLSYTTFAFGRPSGSAPTISPQGAVIVSLQVTNTGTVPSAETVQLYVHPVAPSIDRPVQELKGFQKVFLNPGESRRVAIPLAWQNLAYWDERRHDWQVEPGEYDLQLGHSSADIRQTLRIKAENHPGN